MNNEHRFKPLNAKARRKPGFCYVDNLWCIWHCGLGLQQKGMAVLEENIKTIRRLILQFRGLPPEAGQEKDRLRTAWDNLAEHTLLFVDTPEHFNSLKAVVRHGNYTLKEKMNAKAGMLGIHIPFQ